MFNYNRGRFIIIGGVFNFNIFIYMKFNKKKVYLWDDTRPHEDKGSKERRTGNCGD